MIFDSSFLFVVNYQLRDWNFELNKIVNSAYESRIHTLLSNYVWSNVDLICCISPEKALEISESIDKENRLVLIHRYDSLRARKRFLKICNGKTPVIAHWVNEDDFIIDDFSKKRAKHFKIPTIEEGFSQVIEHKNEK